MTAAIDEQNVPIDRKVCAGLIVRGMYSMLIIATGRLCQASYTKPSLS